MKGIMLNTAIVVHPLREREIAVHIFYFSISINLIDIMLIANLLLENYWQQSQRHL